MKPWQKWGLTLTGLSLLLGGASAFLLPEGSVFERPGKVSIDMPQAPLAPFKPPIDAKSLRVSDGALDAFVRILVAKGVAPQDSEAPLRTMSQKQGALIERLSISFSQSSAVSDLLNRAKDALFAGDFFSAEDYLQRAVLIEAALKDESPEGLLVRAEMVAALASFHMLNGNESAAAELSSELADLVPTDGEIERAEALLLEALTIAEPVFGGQSPLLRPHLLKLATLRASQGHFTSAKSLLDRSLLIARKSFGEKYHDTAKELAALGQLELTLERYEDALPLLQQALEMRQSIMGANHPDLVPEISVLARLYHQLQRFDEAESLYKRALAIDRKTLGEDHPNVAIGLNNMAALQFSKGDFKEAKRLFELTLQSVERAFNGDPVRLGQVMANYAELLNAMGQKQDAEHFAEKAKSLLVKAD